MDSILDYYKKGRGEEVLEILREFVAGGNVTVKVDGAPALMIWSSVEGLKGPGVSFKLIAKQLSKGKPGVHFTSEDEIDKYFTERGADAHRINAFKQGLKLAKDVKPGVFLWGDVLFSSRDELEQEDDGLACSPNFLKYVFTGDEFLNRMESADFGIYFHTVVDGSSFAESPVRDLDGLLKPNGQFCIAPADLEPKRVGDMSAVAADIRKLATQIADVDMSDADYAALRRAIKSGDFSALGDRASKLEEIIATIGDINAGLISNYKLTGYHTVANGEDSDGEGFVVSGKSGRVKIVPEEFTAGNLEHIHASNLKEGFEGNKLVLYTTTKDPKFPDYFASGELKFANNAGNNYGLGIYTTFDKPEDSKVGYKNREALYGNVVVRFEADGNKFICFNYEKFKSSPLYRELGEPDSKSYIASQFEHFGISLPAGQFTPSEELTEPQAVYKFYNAMSVSYYERADGTLKTPVDGIVYYGRNDGFVGIVWSPYNMRLTGMEMDGKVEELDIAVDYDDVSAEDRIFDGKRTEEKEEVYKLLKRVSADDPKLGTFTNIVIHDNRKIDVVFKALVPALFNQHHAYVLLENDSLTKIYRMGYKIGTLDGWVAINYDYSGSFESQSLKSLKPVQIPDRITGGIFLAKTEVDSTVCSKLNSLLGRMNGEVILYKCFLTNVSSLKARKITVKTCGAVDPADVGNANIENPEAIVACNTLAEIVADKPKRAKPKTAARTKTSPRRGFASAVEDAKAKLGKE